MDELQPPDNCQYQCTACLLSARQLSPTLPRPEALLQLKAQVLSSSGTGPCLDDPQRACCCLSSADVSCTGQHWLQPFQGCHHDWDQRLLPVDQSRRSSALIMCTVAMQELTFSPALDLSVLLLSSKCKPGRALGLPNGGKWTPQSKAHLVSQFATWTCCIAMPGNEMMQLPCLVLTSTALCTPPV